MGERDIAKKAVGDKKGGENVSFRLPGWGGVLPTSPTIEQQHLPCQASVHLTRENRDVVAKEANHRRACLCDFVTFRSEHVNGKKVMSSYGKTYRTKGKKRTYVKESLYVVSVTGFAARVCEAAVRNGRIQDFSQHAA